MSTPMNEGQRRPEGGAEAPAWGAGGRCPAFGRTDRGGLGA